MAHFESTLKSIKHSQLRAWIESMIELCTPENIHLCDGSQAEFDTICAEMVTKGTFIKLNEKLRPGSYLCRSNPADVARVEDRTFICSKREEDAGATNNWMDPEKMKTKLRSDFRGVMSGRTMYIIAFSMGPVC
jgi:phosphoenolpyruvate carboxykinase (GTP)